MQITTFNISLVVHGTVAENIEYEKVNFKYLAIVDEFTLWTNCGVETCISLSDISFDLVQEQSNPYAVPISMGIFEVLESPLDITTSTIIRRIVANHEAYQVYFGILSYVKIVGKLI